MSRIRVAISANGLGAEVSIAAGPVATAEQLAAALAAAGVVHGIDQAAVSEIAKRLADAAFTGKATIAHGDAPQPGADGSIELAVATVVRAGTTSADGHIDFRERDHLPPAIAGETVGRIVQPTAGKPGRDIRGREIRVPAGKPFTPRLGPGVRGELDGGVVAVRADVVLVNGNRLIDVIDLWRHDGDVDLRSGNLHTHGSLLVTGDVREGATVTGEGAVLVSGGVLDGAVRATGNATIEQGVMGDKSFVASGGDVRTHHATSAVICAEGAVRIDAQMAHCWVFAESIELLQGRGQAFGGELRARNSLSLLVAGTEQGAPTLLAIGDRVSLEQLLALREASRPDKLQAKPAKKAVAVAELSQALRQHLRDCSISIHGTCWPGVRVQFGNASFDVREPLRRVRFRLDAEGNTISHEDLP